MKTFILIAFFLAAAFITGFVWGYHSKKSNAHEVDEIHFYNPKLLFEKRVLQEPSFQQIMVAVMRDSLKHITPPYKRERIEAVIKSIETRRHLKDFIKLLNLNDTTYKIIVSNGEARKNRDDYYLINNDSVYYVKTLKLMEDIKPDF